MRLIQIGVVVVVIVVVGAIAFVFRDRLSGSAGDLQVGDCFDVPASETIEDVQHQPCTDPHDGEVFVVRDYTGSDPYPALADFEAWASDQCAGTEFEAYVGATYDSRDDVSIGYLYPLEDGWGSGDREMTCYLSPVSGEKVSASYRKAVP